MNTFVYRHTTLRSSPRLMWAVMLGLSLSALPAPTLAETSRPGLYHSWIMRGQVLSADSGKGIICIGKRDNAKAGDVLTVVRQTPVTSGGPRASGFRPVQVGQVRLTRIVDEHYSEFEVVKGEPQVHDTVELVKQ